MRVVAVGMAAVLSAGQWGRGPWREEELGREGGPDLEPARGGGGGGANTNQ